MMNNIGIKFIIILSTTIEYIDSYKPDITLT